MTQNNAKHLTLLKVMYDTTAGQQEMLAVGKALSEMTETEQQEFYDFQHVVGNHFVTVMEELDNGLEALADSFPNETDPRKWDLSDWFVFEQAITGHKYEQFYRTYANQQPNIHLVWEEIESRL